MHDIGLKCEKLSRKIGGVGAKRERNRAQTMAELRVVANHEVRRGAALRTRVPNVNAFARNHRCVVRILAYTRIERDDDRRCESEAFRFNRAEGKLPLRTTCSETSNHVHDARLPTRCARARWRVEYPRNGLERVLLQRDVCNAVQERIHFRGSIAATQASRATHECTSHTFAEDECALQ